MMYSVVGSSCVVLMLLCDDVRTARGGREQQTGLWLTKLLLPISKISLL